MDRRKHAPHSLGQRLTMAGIQPWACSCRDGEWGAPRRPRPWHWLHVEPPATEAAPSPPGQHQRSEELARLEAALFLAREPLTPRRLAKLARLADGTRARSLIKELRQLQDASGSAFRVEQIAGGYQVLTRGPFGPWVRRLLDQPPGSRLSSAALETLAIVAYRQPVTRAEIESIRGVGSEEMLRQLLDRDLVAIGGRAEDLGRPNVYVTTRRFLAAFGLARIEDIPPVDPGPGALPRDQGEPSGGGEDFQA
ncbi:MAG: SMC-Scp complex subunit ScpB [Pirellulales bacterium]